MNQFSRRRALLFGLVSCSSVVSGCFWDGSTSEAPALPPSAAPGPPAPTPTPTPTPTPSPTPPSPAPAPPPVGWSVSPTPYFLSGTGAVFDLSTTLPAGVKRGGLFGISPSGAALPAGMSLSPTGMLSVGNAAAGRADGVVFTYAEPVG